MTIREATRLTGREKTTYVNGRDQHLKSAITCAYTLECFEPIADWYLYVSLSLLNTQVEYPL